MVSTANRPRTPGEVEVAINLRQMNGRADCGVQIVLRGLRSTTAMVYSTVQRGDDPDRGVGDDVK